MKITLKVDI